MAVTQELVEPVRGTSRREGWVGCISSACAIYWIEGVDVLKKCESAWRNRSILQDESCEGEREMRVCGSVCVCVKCVCKGYVCVLCCTPWNRLAE